MRTFLDEPLHTRSLNNALRETVSARDNPPVQRCVMLGVHRGGTKYTPSSLFFEKRPLQSMRSLWGYVPE